MKDHLEFSLSDPTELAAFAQLTAEWTRQGCTFETRKDATHVSVKLTGGF